MPKQPNILDYIQELKDRINILEKSSSTVTPTQAVPIGTIASYGGATAPTGYLLCNGAEVSRTTYADLFTAIGTTFGTGNGSTTFNLPNLGQRFPLGKASSGTGSTLGSTGGVIDHKHLGHSNGGDLRAAIGAAWGDAGSINYVADGAVNPNDGTTRNGTYAVNGSSSGNRSFSHYTPVYGYTSTNNPPYQVVNFIIKATEVVDVITPTIALADSGWTPVTMTNSWVAYDNIYGRTDNTLVRKIGNVVYMRGLVKSGTLTVSAFTLPVGWRPAIHMIFGIASWDVFHELRVHSTGEVIPYSGGNNGWCSISCSFPVD